jgi:Ca2+/H+ antiporter, TMEM165/GDT1 family
MKRKPLFILIPIALFFAVGGIVMLLWNWLIPAIFGLKAITYLQALGLFLLSRILLGSFGFGNKKPPFANPKFREKMMNMTDVERQQFKEEWKSRCKK